MQSRGILFSVVIFLMLIVLLVMSAIQVKQRDREFVQNRDIKDLLTEMRDELSRRPVGSGSVPDAGQQGVETGKDDGDWLVRSLPDEPDSLNPITVNDYYNSTVHRWMSEQLVRRSFETPDVWMPELATAWEISDDKLSITFHLRKGVRWHDGEPFTAEDVKFTFDTIRNLGVECGPLRNYYEDCERLEMLDDYTVRFVWKKKYFGAFSASGEMLIIPRHIYDFDPEKPEQFNNHPFNRKAMGTGPYKFVEWKTNEKIVLERNDEYWGEKPHYRKLVWKIVTDDSVRLNLLKSGELDFVGLSPEQWTKMTNSKRFLKKFSKTTNYIPSYTYLGWNARKPWFQDKRVRRAMTHLVPRRQFLEKNLHGLGVVVSGNFYFRSPEYNSNIKAYEYNPTEAVRLLKEVGWIDHDGDGIRDKDGIKFDFELLTIPGSDWARQLSSVVKEELKNVGIVARISPLEWAQFLQRVNELKFDAVTLGWVLGWESDPYQLWHSSQTDEYESNHCGFANEEADRIIEEARETFDLEKRRKLFHRFHEILHEEQPYTFLFTRKALLAHDKRIQDVNMYDIRPGYDVREMWVPLARQKYK